VGVVLLFLLFLKLEWKEKVEKMVKNGGVCVTTVEGEVLYSFNGEKKLIPASILKIVTSLVFLEEVGKEFRFKTEFYKDSLNNLYIKGYGDPFLISEEVKIIIDSLKGKITFPIFNLYLDNSFFSPPFKIEGVKYSSSPSYASVGALVVNFNTVYVRIKNGKVYSAEPQTPLTPIAKKIALQYQGEGIFRINTGGEEKNHLQYVGELVKEFMKRKEIQVKGKIKKKKINPQQEELIYAHYSSKTVEEVIKELLKHSNNFVANQLLLYMGAHKYGGRGSFFKGLKVVNNFLGKIGVKGFEIKEGSGLSILNKVTPVGMCRVLKKFYPYKELLPKEKEVYKKTGTLKEVRALAGYFITKKNKKEVCFTVIFNYKLGECMKVVNILKENL